MHRVAGLVIAILLAQHQTHGTTNASEQTCFLGHFWMKLPTQFRAIFDMQESLDMHLL